MGEAADLQIGPLDPARQRQSFLKVPACVGELERPQLARAERHQRQRPDLLRATNRGGRPCRSRGLERVHGVPCGAEVAALRRRRQTDARQMQLKLPCALLGDVGRMPLGARDICIRLVEQAVAQADAGECNREL
jgi:hypothetical protein